MSGEMTKKDLEPGGEWFDAAQELWAAANQGGFDGEVLPFDKYQGPYCNLIKEGLIVGELWLVEDDRFLCKVRDGRKEESKIVNSGKDLYDFVLSVWKEWNNGYNPEKINEDETVLDKGDFLILKTDDSEKIFDKESIGDELYCIVKNFGRKMIEYNYKYWTERE